jgi:hypothetical protein
MKISFKIRFIDGSYIGFTEEGPSESEAISNFIKAVDNIIKGFSNGKSKTMTMTCLTQTICLSRDKVTYMGYTKEEE